MEIGQKPMEIGQKPMEIGQKPMEIGQKPMEIGLNTNQLCLLHELYTHKNVGFSASSQRHTHTTSRPQYQSL